MRSLRLEILAIAVIGALVLGARMSLPPMVDWDEATYAEVSRAIVSTGDWMNLTWNGEPYVKKPPLLFWMTAGSFKVLGESELAARLPSVALGIGTMLLLYFGVSPFAGRVAGTIAALLPLNFYFFVARGGRECATDSPLLFFTTLALFALVKGLRNRRWLSVTGVATGLAILSKGLAGLIAPSAAIAAVMLLPEFNVLGASGLAVVGLSASLVAAPWFIHQAVHNLPLFFSTFLGHETLQRIASHLEDDPHGLSFTLRTFYSEVSVLWPILIPLPVMLAVAWRQGLQTQLRRIDPAVKLWVVWLVVALGAACTVRTRLQWYVLPALPPVALLAGTLLGRALTRTGPLAGWSKGLAALAVATLVAVAPLRLYAIDYGFQMQRDRSMPVFLMAQRAHRVAAEHGGGELFFAGPVLPTLAYYSRMKCNFAAPHVLEVINFEPQRVALPQIGFHDLVLVDPSGTATRISNLDEEWAWFESGSSDSDSADADAE